MLIFKDLLQPRLVVQSVKNIVFFVVMYLIFFSTAFADQTTAPLVPRSISISQIDAGLRVNWAEDAASDIAGYKIYYGKESGNYTQAATYARAYAGSQYYDLTGIDNCTTYYIAVAAYDLYGNESAKSVEVHAKSGSAGAPSAPFGVIATVGAGAITLNWTPNPACDVYYYYVYRSTTPGSGYQNIGSTPAATLSYKDTGVGNGITYYYVIKAYDQFGNYSQASSEVSAVAAGDITPPPAPYSLSLSQLDNGLQIYWNETTTPDIAGYKIYYGTSSGNYSQTSTYVRPYTGGHSFNLTGLTNCTDYYIAVSAYDSSGNESTKSVEVHGKSGSLGVPSAPTGVTATSENGAVTLSWSPVECDAIQYYIYRSTTSGSGYQQIGSVSATTTSYKNTGLVNGTTYYYELRAYDVAGNWSAYSTPISIIVGDTTAPPVPSSVSLTQLDNGLQVYWNEIATPDIAGYKIYYGTSSGNYSQTSTYVRPYAGGNSFNLTGLTNCTDYYVTVSAYDLSGNESAKTAEVHLKSASIGAPAAPSGVTAASASGAITLAWSANTECDLGGYNIYRSTTQGSGYQYLGTTNSTTTIYKDSSVVNGTNYYYLVRVKDTYSQESLNSVEVPITAGDTTAPDAPASVNASQIEGGIHLAWNQITTPDINGYKIYFGTSSGNYSQTKTYGYKNSGAVSYYLSGLLDCTDYYLAISAYDLSGNESAKSAEIHLKSSKSGAPAAPVALVGEAKGTSAVLTWNQNAECDLKEYKVYRSQTSGAGFSLIATAQNATYTNAGLSPGVSYYYRVTAVDTTNLASSASAETFITTRSISQPTVNVVSLSTKATNITLTGTKESNSYLFVNNVNTAAPYASTDWSYPVDLVEGSNSFSLFLRDEAGNQSGTVSTSVIRDTAGPVLGSSNPAANALAATVDSITVSFSDTAGLDLPASATGAIVKNASGSTIDGSWSVSGSALLFTPAASLAEGSYTVTLYPVDALGNKGYASFSFIVDRAQPTVATVAMNQPSPHKVETVIFSITFSEAMDTTLAPQVSIIRPGSPDLTYPLSGAWQGDKKTWQGAYSFTLATGDGSYDLKITGAKDAAGNPMNDHRSTALFILKTAAPAAPTVAAVTTPTKTVTQTLSGTKPAGTALVINNVVRVTLNQDTAWSFNYPLNEGANTLTIVTRDDAGNDSAAITPAPVITLDTTPPTFSIDTYKTPTATATQTISGKKEAGCVVKMNGIVIVDATDQTTSWSQQIDLTSSNGFSKRFDFVVTDQMGNTTTKSLDLLYDSSPPTALATGVLTSDGNGKGTEVKLAWPSFVEPGDIGYYRIYMSSAAFTSVNGLTPLATVDKGVKTYTATGLTSGTDYWFAVVPVDAGGNAETGVIAVKGVPSDGLAPEEVTGLAAWAGYSATDSNTISLTWTASKNSAGDLSDQLLYVDDGKGYGTGTPLSKTALNYTVKGLVDATLYKLKITTKDSGGHESAGTVVQAVTRLANPTGVTATPGSGKATISWTAVASSYVKAYNLYRVKSPDSQSDVASMTLIKNQTGTSYTDSGLTNGEIYQYAVTTVNSSGAERSNVTSVAVTPRGDTTGPVLSGLNLASNQVVTVPMILTASASDAESTVARIELYIDGLLSTTANSASLSYPWNVVKTTDGNHTIKLVAYDAPGNKTETSIPVVVSLAAPTAPAISAHGIVRTTPDYAVSISGTTQPDTTITLRLNGTVITQTTSIGSTFSISPVTLPEGDNLVAVKASHRGGESAWSVDYRITVDTGAPQPPVGLSVTRAAGGLLQFVWSAGAGERPSGYNLYESRSSFTTVGAAGVTRSNPALITYQLKDYTPADDTERYFGITSVDAAGNESPLSNIVQAAADRATPVVATIAFTASGGATPSVFGAGTLNVALTVSEPLRELPFLSLEPLTGSPLVLDLKKTGDTRYEATVSLDATSIHGSTTWKFSGKDMVGNRGTASGQGPLIDVHGPVADITAPLNLLSSANGTVSVSIALDEPSVTTPVITIKAADGSSATVASLVGSNGGKSWSGTLDPSGLGDGTARFSIANCSDSLGNSGSTIRTGATIIVYKTTPPAPAVPASISAATRKGGEIAIAWSAVTDSQGYRIYRRGEAESSAAAVATTTSVTTLTDLPPVDGTYYYSVSALGQLNAESQRSGETKVVSDRTGPAVPTALTLVLSGNGIVATWQPGNPQGESPYAYRLYRSTEAITSISGLTPVTTVKPLSATDPAPVRTQAFYAVTSLDALGNESAPSSSIELAVPVAPVKSLTLTRIDDGKPMLSWEAGETGLAGFHIYRNGTRITETPTTSTSFSDGYYTGGTATYGIASVDNNGTVSPVREVVLPRLTVGLASGTVMRRGLVENIKLIATLPADEQQSVTIDTVTLKIGSLPESSLSGSFPVSASTPAEIVKVGATEANAAAQVAVVATAVMNPAPGTVVKITRSSLAGVMDSGSALEIFNEPLVRGTQGTVRIKINNLGSAQMSIVTSENNGPSSQVRIAIKDQDGNLLAEGRLNQRAGGSVVASGSYATARIEPGESFLSDPITFSVPSNAPYRTVIEAVVGTTYYHYGQPDQVVAPGLSQTVASTIADVSYLATASTDKTVYKQGEKVLISGTVISTANNAAMPSVPVRIGISVNGFDRFFTVNSDAAGGFSYTFVPGSNEVGSYSVWASHPDLSDRNVQARFSIIGLQISPLLANISLIKGQSWDIPVTLANIGGSTLTGLTLNPSSSSGITATVVNAGADSLTSGERRTITLRIATASTVADNGLANLEIHTAEGLGGKIDVVVATGTALPRIDAKPSYIDTGLVRGTQRIENFAISNTGLGPLVNARIEGPSLAWLSLANDRLLGDIPANSNKVMGLVIRPGEDVAQGVYNDRLVIYSDNHIPYTYNIQVSVTSSAVGNVMFDLLNELMQDVVGATISLQNQSLPELIYTLKSGADGTVSQFDIPEGRYTYNISAPNHKPVSGSVSIVPGVTVTVPVAMQVNLIQIEWSVTPVIIQDRYQITINQTFETNVPTSVLVVDPPVMNIPDIAPGGVFNGEYTITNYGLISVDYKGMSIPQGYLDYEIEVLATMPLTIGPQQKVTVPYRIKRRAQ